MPAGRVPTHRIPIEFTGAVKVFRPPEMIHLAEPVTVRLHINTIRGRIAFSACLVDVQSAEIGFVLVHFAHGFGIRGSASVILTSSPVFRRCSWRLTLRPTISLSTALPTLHRTLGSASRFTDPARSPPSRKFPLGATLGSIILEVIRCFSRRRSPRTCATDVLLRSINASTRVIFSVQQNKNLHSSTTM